MSFHYSLCVFAPPMLATPLSQNLLWNQKITENISEALHILHSWNPEWNPKPMHKPTAQPGVGPLPLMSGHVSHLRPTVPMLVHDGSHRGKQLCLENSIQEQISQHQLHPLFYLQQQCCCSHCQCSVDERRCLDQGEFSSSFGPLV